MATATAAAMAAVMALKESAGEVPTMLSVSRQREHLFVQMYVNVHLSECEVLGVGLRRSHTAPAALLRTLEVL